MLLSRRSLARRASVYSLLLGVAGITACGDSPTGSRRGVAFTFSELSGDHQRGAPRHALAQPVSVRAVDANSRPVAGVAVTWSASDGGTVEPRVTTTDAGGLATTNWTLGPALGPQHVYAISDDNALSAEFTATAGEGSVDIGLTLLSLSTPDGSGQTVHPDHVAVAAPWAAASQYLVITPYPNGNASFENPSLFAGRDGIAWSAPTGVTNPIVSPAGGYLSDPDGVFVPETNELWIYYRSVDVQNEIRLVKSADGVRFGTSTTVAHGANHTLVSPTVVRRGATDWLMWAVNANVGCTASATTVELRRSTNGTDWSDAKTVSLAQPGYSVWHIDVQWIPSRREFWALYNVKTPGSCTTPAVFLATSADGESWTTYPSPVLAHGAMPAFEDVVYRSTFEYDATTDAISFWYSGARYESSNYVWRSAYERRARPDVFAAIQTKPVAASLDRQPRRNVPPLLDAP
jgi:hypothetical protein